MKQFAFGLRVLAIGLAIAVLSACGGARGLVPGNATQISQYRPASGGAWSKNSVSGEDLLYLAGVYQGEVSIYTWPAGVPVATLSGFIGARGECLDDKGDVFIVAYASKSYTSSVVYEYAHGGTEPIASFDDPGVGGTCSVDSTSGTLAVANASDHNNPFGDYGSVAVYAEASGNPTMYYSSQQFYFDSCAYDSKGDLYLTAPSQYRDQFDLITLQNGSSSFELMSLDTNLYGSPGAFTPSVQWDGKYVTVSSAADARRGPVTIYRLRISGINAKAIGATMLTSKKDYPTESQSWIYDKTITGLNFYRHGALEASIWDYPKGGKPQGNIRIGKVDVPFGVIVSPAEP